MVGHVLRDRGYDVQGPKSGSVRDQYVSGPSESSEFPAYMLDGS